MWQLLWCMRRPLSPQTGVIRSFISNWLHFYNTVNWLGVMGYNHSWLKIITSIEIVVWYLKVSSFIAQYSVFRTVQSALHCTSLTDLFTQTPSRFLWETPSHMLYLIREGCSYTYPPPGTHLYSWVNWSNVEWKNMPKVLTLQHRIRNRVLVIESTKLYPWAIALYN